MARAPTYMESVAQQVRRAIESNPEGVLDWIANNRPQAELLLEQAQRNRYALARYDVNEFIEVVGRHEQTGDRLFQHAVHERFQELASKHTRFVLWAHIESSKSSQLTVLRTLWRIGNNPNIRIAICSATQDQAAKFVKAIKTYIERPGPLHEVFPHLRPGTKWSDTKLIVQRDNVSKDYTVQAVGVGTGILGARLDLVILDDVLSLDNTSTPHRREAVWQWWRSTVAGRLTAKAEAFAVTTAWHPQDFLHRLVAEEGWHSERMPVVDEAGVPLWPEVWPPERIEEARVRMGPFEFSRQLLCLARDDSEARFKKEWIDLALQLGDGRSLPHHLSSVPAGYRVYTGVDLGTGPSTGGRRENDPSALFTLCVHPNERREVLCCESGRWDGPEIVRRIAHTHSRYGGIMVVESNAAQMFIVQFTKDLGAIPVMPFNTGSNKAHPEFGIESMAVEMSNGKWIVPNVHGRTSRDIDAWISEMLFYSPASHTGDRLMASWIAREAAERRVGKPGKVRVGRVPSRKR